MRRQSQQNNNVIYIFIDSRPSLSSFLPSLEVVLVLVLLQGSVIPSILLASVSFY
jgi:hypothetical protein